MIFSVIYLEVYGTMNAKSFLIDLDGVLYVNKKPIEGAKESISFLEDNGYHYRFVSNTTTKSRSTLAAFLVTMGFSVPEEFIFTPAIAAAKRIMSAGDKTCFLAAKGDVKNDFEDAGVTFAEEDVDFVVIGDAEDRFTFDLLNKSFRLIMGGAQIIALEKDRYWMGSNGLQLAAGPFVAGLEYATGTVAEVMGKPSPDFFGLALQDIGAVPKEAAMIGDDINTDVGGAQKVGMSGILVKTGKYRDDVVRRSLVKPDLILESIANLGDHL